MSEHTVTMHYTIDDDGIHLWCTCGWMHNLGFGPEPMLALQKTFRHRAFPQEKGDSDAVTISRSALITWLGETFVSDRYQTEEELADFVSRAINENLVIEQEQT